MRDLTRFRALNIRGRRLVVAMPERQAEAISKSPLYRNFARPTARHALRAARWVAGRRAAAVNPGFSGIVIPASPPRPEDIDPDGLDLIQRIAPYEWVHTIDVGHGVATPGIVDFRHRVSGCGIPDSLAGLRCLDVASRDGFWAFEMERRGASEVVAIVRPAYGDAEAPPNGEGAVASFDVAHEVLGSRVRVEDTGVYDLDPDRLGQFDLVVVSDVLRFCRNPQLALERIRTVCRGAAVVAERVNPGLDRYGEVCLTELVADVGGRRRGWWLPGTKTLRWMMVIAGFEPIEETDRVNFYVPGQGWAHQVVFRAGAPADPAWARAALSADLNAPPATPVPARRERTLEVGSVRLTLGSPDSPLLPINARRSPQGPTVSAIPTAPVPTPAGAEAAAVAEKVAGVKWYHTLELGDGIVTPGFVDHRAQVPLYHLPDSLAGLRCLDIATFDGFWAFEMERRGAAEVVGVDVEKGTDCDVPLVILDRAVREFDEEPMGAGFRLAKRLLESRVRHQVCNVYDLAPDRVGKFDVVFLSDLLLHLRDPQLALQRAFSVCRGTLVLAEVYNPALESFQVPMSQFVPWFPGHWTWWLPSLATLRRMLHVAGFETLVEHERFTLETRSGPCDKVVIHATVPGATPLLGEA